jgi:glycosyltransferase involved in cell wall biosynthesis
MLFDKGVVEFINAAKTIKGAVKGRAIFLLAGEPDNGNPSSIPEEKLKSMEEDNYISWIGFQEDMLSILQQSNLVVLPSYYREGLPKSLIEACAIGRAIITTDAIGCRECVKDGYNGYLVPARNVNILAEKMLFLINHPEIRLKMGQNGRYIAEEKFSINTVIQKHFEIYNKILLL